MGGRIWLKVNGELRQAADIGQLVMDVPHTIAALSRLYELKAGDLIFTGTPAGVGPLKVGDRIECGIDGLDLLRNHIVVA
jgi:fumarylpyruvate hydrolase